MVYKRKTFKKIKCKYCDTPVKVTSEAINVTCWRCVQSLVDPPTFNNKKTVSSGKLQGWHFMKEYVHSDETVWHNGIEQPNLKGTLKPTEKKPVKKRDFSAEDHIKRINSLQIHTLKLKLQSETRKTKINEIEIKIRKLTRGMKKKFYKIN